MSVKHQITLPYIEQEININ